MKKIIIKDMVGSKGTDHLDRDHHLMDGGDDDDDDGGGVEPPSSGVACSICLDLVSDSGGRSRAKLHCGHEFHLGMLINFFFFFFVWLLVNLILIYLGYWVFYFM